MNRPRPTASVTDVESSLPPEGPIAAYHNGGYSPGGRESRPSRRWFYDSPSGSFGLSSHQERDSPPRKKIGLSDVSSANGRFTAATAGPSVSWRQP